MAPLGSPDNPITIGIINPTPETEQTDGLAQLASQLSGSLQLSVEGKIYQDYMSLELALQKNELHFAWLQTPEYLLATQKDLVSSILGVNSLGVSAYGIQYLAHRDAGLEEYFDVGSNTATSSPEHALQQFAGMRPCLTNSKSLAGYWVPPLAYLAQSNISWEPPVETQSYNASLRALYIQGICALLQPMPSAPIRAVLQRSSPIYPTSSKTTCHLDFTAHHPKPFFGSLKPRWPFCTNACIRIPA